MKQDKEYFAFISYKSEDVEWATWLQHELEHYHLPASFNGRTDVPQELRPVFRDIDELSAGNLPEQIKQALANSQNLIVICSPQAAKSPWVNQEVETFIALGRTGRIFPFIVEGNSPSEFFPPALRDLPKNEERLGGDVSKKGRDAAFVKVVAGMLGVSFDTLWKRYEREKAEEERKIREQRDHLLKIQSKFLAEKALSLISEGDPFTARAILLDALPINMENPSRPYVPHAEFALRKALQYHGAKIVHHDYVNYSTFSPDGTKLVSACNDHNVYIWDLRTGTCINKLYGHTGIVNSALFSSNGNYIISASDDWTIRIWNSKKGEALKILRLPGYRVNFASISCDGKYIVSASIDKNARLWEVESGKCIKILEGHSDQINYAEFSHDGNRIVTASKDHSIRVWDSVNGNCLHVIDGHDDIVNTATFSPDDKFILSASNDGRTIVWDSQMGDLISCFKNGGKPVTSAVFSPNGESFLSVSSDFHEQAVCLRNVESGNIIQRFMGHEYYIRSATYSNDGSRIVTASMDKTIRIWDLPYGKCFCKSNCLDSHLSDISNDGVYKVRVGEKNTIQVFTMPNYKCIVQEWDTQDDIIESVVFSDDSQYILAVCSNRIDDPLESITNGTFSPPVFKDCVRSLEFKSLQSILADMRAHYIIKHLSTEELQKYYLD